MHHARHPTQHVSEDEVLKIYHVPETDFKINNKSIR